MALDRRSIETKDFPIERRGYSPTAVKEYLSALADEVEQLSRSSSQRSSPAPLSSTASERIRSLLEAAEASAAEIERGAEADARDVREQANGEAQATRDRAAAQAQERVGAVTTSTEAMLERLRAMDGELGSLRTGCERLRDELTQLEGGLSEVAGAIEPSAARSAGPTVPRVLGLKPKTASAQPEPEPELEAGTPPPTPAPSDSVNGANGTAPAGESGDEADGVRLIALNMALTGTPRGETARYLNENFPSTNADSLLDEVYSSVDR